MKNENEKERKQGGVTFKNNKVCEGETIRNANELIIENDQSAKS